MAKSVARYESIKALQRPARAVEPPEDETIVGELVDDSETPDMVYIGTPVDPKDAAIALAALSIAAMFVVLVLQNQDHEHRCDTQRCECYSDVLGLNWGADVNHIGPDRVIDQLTDDSVVLRGLHSPCGPLECLDTLVSCNRFRHSYSDEAGDSRLLWLWELSRQLFPMDWEFGLLKRLDKSID